PRGAGGGGGAPRRLPQRLARQLPRPARQLRPGDPGRALRPGLLLGRRPQRTLTLASHSPSRPAAAALAPPLLLAAHPPRPTDPPAVPSMALSSVAVDAPAAGVAATAAAGAVVVEKGYRATFDAVELSEEVTWGDGRVFKKFVIGPGKLKASQRDAKYAYFA